MANPAQQYYSYDKTILYLSCYDEAESVKTETIEELIRNDDDLYFTHERFNGKVAIHFAALGLNPDILKCIIKHSKNNINFVDYSGNTALNILIKEGRSKKENFVKCVKLLIDSGIDINKPDNQNVPPIYWAIKKGYTEIVNLLLQRTDININIIVNNQIIRDLL